MSQSFDPNSNTTPRSIPPAFEQLSCVSGLITRSLFTNDSIDLFVSTLQDSASGKLPLIKDLPRGVLDLSTDNEWLESLIRSMDGRQLYHCATAAIEGARAELSSFFTGDVEGDAAFASLLRRVISTPHNERRFQISDWDRKCILEVLKALNRLWIDYSRAATLILGKRNIPDIDVAQVKNCSSLLTESAFSLNETKKILREGTLTKYHLNGSDFTQL